MKKYSVFLRAFEIDDYKAINEWRNDPSIWSLTCGRFKYVSSEMEKSWVHDKMMNNQKDIYLAICLNDESKRIIGYTSLNNIDYTNQCVHGGGIVIGDKNYRDGNTLIDAYLLKLKYAFDDLCMHRYSGRCLEIHIQSRIMQEMMGMKLEGIERESLFKNGIFNNVCLYSILSSEYRELAENGGYEELSIAKRAHKIRKSLKK